MGRGGEGIDVDLFVCVGDGWRGYGIKGGQIRMEKGEWIGIEKGIGIKE